MALSPFDTRVFWMAFLGSERTRGIMNSLDNAIDFAPLVAGGTATCLLLWLVVWARKNYFGLRPLREIIWAEDGVSYALPFVMTMPIFMVIVLAIVQTGLLLLTKVAVIRATAVAARSASVWLPHQDMPIETRQKWIRHAACLSLTPFAPATMNGALTVPEGPAEDSLPVLAAQANRYEAAATDYLIMAKYLQTENRLDLTATDLTVPDAQDNGQYRIDLAFHAPIYAPFLHLMFNNGSRVPRSYVIRHHYEMTGDAARSPDRHLGIFYRSQP